ncbi:MAG: hypothetical protein ACKO2C_10720 [Actinomycetes bacterium]
MGATPAEVADNLAAFIEIRGGAAFLNVPVSGNGSAWPQGTPVHRVDAVWFPTGVTGSLVDLAHEDVGSDAHAQFVEALTSIDAVLMSGHGYADRTVFGRLVAGREMLSRSYPTHRRLDAIALGNKLDARGVPYLAEGIEVLALDGSRLSGPTVHRASARREPAESTYEDRLLEQYFDVALDGQGTLWFEVVIGSARLDALYVPNVPGGRSFWGGDVDHLAATIAEHDVEVIEAKWELNLDVIGQVIAGAVMLAHESPRHRLVRQTVVVGKSHDSALEWLCAKRGIRVVQLDLP